jgi:hypothetical protein
MGLDRARRALPLAHLDGLDDADPHHGLIVEPIAS